MAKIKVFGSIMNRINEAQNAKAPKVGDGVTIYYYSDRSAGTISRVSESGKTFWYKPDKAVRVDKNGMSESQDYIYELQPQAQEVKVYKTKDGRWRQSKHSSYVGVGERDAYRDYTF